MIIKKAIKKNRGMTYVELIVVLSIFAVMTSVVIFNYREFQVKVDIKNLASDIALKIVEAQKSSLSGNLPAQTPTVSDPAKWKPAYGVYFDATGDSFIYFTDLNNNNWFDDAPCTGECLDEINITKNYYISRIDSYLGSTLTQITVPLAITFKRPNSGATFSHSNGIPLTFDYIQITIASPSPQSVTASIKIYPSGRIQVN
ncbi:MAG: type II secretion system protein [Patescibacteria group bacterium]